MDLGYLNIPFIYKGSDLIHPSPIKDGLVLWYDFSGMSNSFENRDIATDLSGNGNHGTLQNFAYSEGSGYDKRGLLFDGVDDRISKTVNPALENLEDVTFDIVFSVNRLGTAQRLIDMDWTYISLAIWGNNRINFNAGGLSTTNSLSQYRVPLDKVLHLSAVYDMNSGMVSFYINGVKDSQVQNSGVLKGETSGLSIGSTSTGNNQSTSGVISSVKIYNRPLTAEEIQHNYQIEKERFGIGGSEI